MRSRASWGRGGWHGPHQSAPTRRCQASSCRHARPIGDRLRGLMARSEGRGLRAGFGGATERPWQTNWCERTSRIQAGDTVRDSAAWLRSTGQYADEIAHARGPVTAPVPLGDSVTLAEIDWRRPGPARADQRQEPGAGHRAADPRAVSHPVSPGRQGESRPAAEHKPPYRSPRRFGVIRSSVKRRSHRVDGPRRPGDPRPSGVTCRGAGSMLRAGTGPRSLRTWRKNLQATISQRRPQQHSQPNESVHRAGDRILVAVLQLPAYQ